MGTSDRHDFNTLTVGKSRPGNRAIVDSLFNPIGGGTLAGLERVRYCTGKYNESVRGQTRQFPAHVRAVWAEKRKDKHGPYFTMFALVTKKGGAA